MRRNRSYKVLNAWRCYLTGMHMNLNTDHYTRCISTLETVLRERLGRGEA